MRPLRIMLDTRMAFHGGIGTYVRHLVPALAASGAVERCCVAGAPPEAFGPTEGPLCHHPYPAPIYSVREQWVVPNNIHGAAPWHSPHYNIPLRWRGPLVVTIHDLIPVRHPSWMRTPLAAPYAAFMLRQVARRAAAVIAVSDATKQRFCAWAGVAASRVTTIPHGVSPRFAEPVPEARQTQLLQAHGVRRPFALWVSAVRPHKNSLVALRAFAALRARHRIPHQLVMIGARPSWYRAPLEEARRLGLGDTVRWIGPVADEFLPAWYQAARVLLMPSYEEGFGLPVLEAMASGLPVLISTAPALSELVDNQSVTIDPDDVDGWVEHLYTVMFDDDRHRILRQHGLSRASRFTWARSAAQHLDVYRAAAA